MNVKISQMTSMVTLVLLTIGLLFSSACTDSETDPCSAVECQNGGTKSLNFAGDACECECPQGFAGELCQEEVSTNPCDDFECLNGGTKNLNFAGDTCECDCPEGYSGENCELG